MQTILRYVFIILFTLVGVAGNAQENIGNALGELRSPEMLDDQSVVFRLWAPEAKEVRLLGNWMDQSERSGAAMERNAEGLWCIRVKELYPDLFLYNFLVDGVKINDPLNVYQVRDVNQVFNYFITNGNPADLYKTQNVAHGTLSKVWYPSALVGGHRRMTIYFPPGYEAEQQDYPVLYLLHGMGGDEDAWPTLGRLSQIMDNLIASGQAAPMIVVMPNGHTSNSAAPGSSAKGEYPVAFSTPDVGSGDMESTFMEIVDVVESRYRVRKEKESRAIAGLSMGGSHTLFIAAANPDVFDYVGLFSAAFRINEKSQRAVYEGFDENLERQMKAGYQLYWMGMGVTDFLYSTGTDYRKRLDKLGMDYIYHESDGGHTWSNWRKYLIEFTSLLFEK